VVAQCFTRSIALVAQFLVRILVLDLAVDYGHHIAEEVPAEPGGLLAAFFGGDQ
jgi:hypothetical protein